MLPSVCVLSCCYPCVPMFFVRRRKPIYSTDRFYLSEMDHLTPQFLLPLHIHHTSYHTQQRSQHPNLSKTATTYHAELHSTMGSIGSAQDRGYSNVLGLGSLQKEEMLQPHRKRKSRTCHRDNGGHGPPGRSLDQFQRFPEVPRRAAIVQSVSRQRPGPAYRFAQAVG